MENNIEGKVVVITGASSGIGKATAVMLAERGAKVVLGARGLNRLEALARRNEATGGDVTYAQTDVRRREELTSLVASRLTATASSTFSSATPASCRCRRWTTCGLKIGKT